MQAGSICADDVPLANGVFLVAKPEMRDPNFRETVVLITEPEIGGGPIGVIVNRPLDVRLSEAVPEIGGVPDKYDRIYGGGPVALNQILYLVRTSQRIERGLLVLPDVYLSGDRKLLEKIIRGETAVTSFRAYAGYSGWGWEQLQAEIDRDDWFVVRADADAIFAADPSTVWKDQIKRANRVMTWDDARPGTGRDFLPQAAAPAVASFADPTAFDHTTVPTMK